MKIQMTFIALVVMNAYSIDAQACKMTPAAADAATISAATHAFASAITDHAQVGIVEATITEASTVEIRATNGSRVLYQVTINSDCSTHSQIKN